MKLKYAFGKYITIGLISALSFVSAQTIASTSMTGRKPVKNPGDILEIVNGKPVKPGEIYAAYTVGVGGDEIMCSGVIVASHYVLTAAHCKEDAEHGKIYFGTDKTNFVFRNVVSVTEHPEYCKKECGTLASVDDDDILVVEFDGDLPAGFSPVAIAPKAALTPNVTIHLAGFGADEHYRYEDILKVTTVPFDAFQGDTEFKTNETLAGTCNGDSGGPAFVEVEGKLQLAGLTSRGDSACRRFGVYTMVNAFDSWLKTVIKQDAPTDPTNPTNPNPTLLSSIQIH